MVEFMLRQVVLSPSTLVSLHSRYSLCQPVKSEVQHLYKHYDKGLDHYDPVGLALEEVNGYFAESSFEMASRSIPRYRNLSLVLDITPICVADWRTKAELY